MKRSQVILFLVLFLILDLIAFAVPLGSVAMLLCVIFRVRFFIDFIADGYEE